MTSSSSSGTSAPTTMWGPLNFWSSSMFGGKNINNKKSSNSVLERLRESAERDLALSSNDANIGLAELSAALEINTSLCHVTICATYLETQCQRGSRLPHEQQQQQQNHELVRLFRAIGSLPSLTTVSFQGRDNSDHIPVENLADLFEANADANADANQITPISLLRDVSFQYVDLAASSQHDMERLGRAMGACSSISTVTMLNVSLFSNNNNNHILSMDPILAHLGNHCRTFELGMKYMPPNAAMDCSTLQQLLGNNNLQSLTLRRRLALDDLHLSTILKSLSGPSSNRNSNLKEIRLDDICLSSSANGNRSTTMIWQQLADMLASNSTIESLELGFAGSNPIRMNHAAVQNITLSLKGNTTLTRFCLRGSCWFDVDTDDLQSQSQSQAQKQSKGAAQTIQKRCWLPLLEDDNFTLQEVELLQNVGPNDDNSNKDDDDDDNWQDAMEFFLQLNRQQVTLPAFSNDDGSNSAPTCGLRSLLRTHNGAIPQDLILPCLQAAMDIQDLQQPMSIMEISDDEWFDDFATPDGNTGGYIHSTDCSRDDGNNNNASGLFYLLSQQPSIVADLQVRIENQDISRLQ